MAGGVVWLLEFRELSKVSNCSLVTTVAQESSLVPAPLFWAPSHTPWAVTTGCDGAMLDAESTGFCAVAGACCPACGDGGPGACVADEGWADSFGAWAFGEGFVICVCARAVPAARKRMKTVRVI